MYDDCIGNCSNYLEPTANIYITETGLKYKIYIYSNCKRYWIKRFFYLHEVKFDHINQIWNETKQIMKIKKTKLKIVLSFCPERSSYERIQVLQCVI